MTELAFPPQATETIVDEDKSTTDPRADQRFEMRMSRRLFQGLAMLANKEGIPKADVIRRSLGLYAQAFEAEGRGQLVGFATIKDGATPEIAELIRLHSVPSEDKDSSASVKAVHNEPFDRFEMRMSEALLNYLEQMSKKEGTSRADVVRRALGLYSLAAAAAARGKVVVFAKLIEGGIVSVIKAIKL